MSKSPFAVRRSLVGTADPRLLDNGTDRKRRNERGRDERRKSDEDATRPPLPAMTHPDPLSPARFLIMVR